MANPLLQTAQQQIAVNNKQIDVERAKGSPEFSLGYFNQSIIGYQNVDGAEKYYGGGKRFQGVQAGVNIPVFNRAVASRVKAAKAETAVAASNYELLQHNLQAQYKQAAQEYEKDRQSLDYYEKTALPNAQLILQQGDKAFRAGEISYIEYLQALKTGSELQLNYLGQLNQYNQSVLRLLYFSGTK
jgi:cobalt-zinc-cadmium resistance protein CzcA